MAHHGLTLTLSSNTRLTLFRTLLKSIILFQHVHLKRNHILVLFKREDTGTNVEQNEKVYKKFALEKSYRIITGHKGIM